MERLVTLAVPGRPVVLGGDPPLDWRDAGDALVEAARRSRLTGALVEVHEAGAVLLTEEQTEHLYRHHRDALVWCLRLEDRLCEVAERLGREGVVDLRVLKGPAVAHLDEIEPSLRTFGDLDLLVPAADLDHAVAVLTGMGAVRPYAERRPGFDHRFAKSVTLTFPDHVEIDLHRTICDGVHGVRVPPGRLLEGADHITLAGRRFSTLDGRARALHAAYHAVLGSPTPSPMHRRDLLGYLGRHDADPGVLAQEAARWRGTAVLAEAVASVLALPGVHLPGWLDWAQLQDVGRREQRIVAAQRRDGSSYGRSRFRVVVELTSWPDRLAYAGAVLVPSREHLATRGVARSSLWRRLVGRRVPAPSAPDTEAGGPAPGSAT